MEFIETVIDFFLHLDAHLKEIIETYGMWTYALLFLVIFCETGFVITPFLPGDSLLFAAGTFAALGSFDIVWLIVLLIIAAIGGDAMNYAIGYRIGAAVFDRPHRLIKRQYLERTHAFYEKYGGKTIIIARFVPIIRTFAPFLAGVGRMTYLKFASYNVIGAILWVLSFTLLGYFFGNLEPVRKNFSLVIFAIIGISVLPAIFEYIRHRIHKNPPAPADDNVEA